MMQLFLLLISCALVAVASGEVTTTAQTPVAPECPNLTAEELKKLEDSKVNDIDPHYLLIGDYYEEVEPQMKDLPDGSWNCVTKSVKIIDENKLRQSITTTNSKTGTQKTVYFTLEKIKNGVYLIRKADQTPVARTYIMSAKVGVVASFICSLEPAANGIGVAFGDLMTWMGIAKPDDTTPYEKPLPKMSNVFVSTYVRTSSTLPGHMKQVVNELKETMSKDVPLFGPIQDAKTCNVLTK